MLKQSHKRRANGTPKRAAIASWNLRRLGQGGFSQTSWLKLRTCVRIAVRRGWRAVLVSDCMTDEPGSFSFRGSGGDWVLVYNRRCGVLLDPGLANMWRRGGSIRYDSADGRSMAVIVPCAGRGLRGKVLSLVSVYGPVSGSSFDAERRVMFDELSGILTQLPFRSVWVLGGDFNAEVGIRGGDDEGCLGPFGIGRRTRVGHQLVEWARGEDLRFLLTFTRQNCRDTWFHPKSGRGHPIDHLLVRPRDHRFLGSSKVLFETPLVESWAPYTDHNPIETKLVKGWIHRTPFRPPTRMRRPPWKVLRGTGKGAQVAQAALSAELDRRVAESWTEVVDLGLGVARAILGEEPRRDPRPWVRGCEGELRELDRAVSAAFSRKRNADDIAVFQAASYEARRCKRRRLAWLREKEVRWWDSRAQLVQERADQGDAFGLFDTFKDLRARGASVHLGEVQPADVAAERDAWAEHLWKIGEGEGSVTEKVWENVPSYTPMSQFWGDARAPNELHAALRQMSLGKAAGEDEVTAEQAPSSGNP